MATYRAIGRLIRASLMLAGPFAIMIPATSRAQNAAVLHAQFKLEKGYFVIDDAASTLDDPEGKFRTRPLAKAAIVRRINRALRDDVEAVFYNLGADEVIALRRSRHIDTEDGETGVDPGLLQASQTLRSERGDLTRRSSSWHDLSGLPADRRDLLRTGFERFLSEERGACWVNRRTPVLYRPPPDEVFEPEAALARSDATEQGRADFVIADPIDAASADSVVLGTDEAAAAAFARAGITRDRIRRVMARLAGRLWSRPVIEREIGDLLVQAGIADASIKRAPSDGCLFAGAERRMLVSPTPVRLRSLTFPRNGTNSATPAKLLSRVLPDRDYRYFRGHPGMLVGGQRTLTTDRPEDIWIFDLASPQGRQLPVSGRFGMLTTSRTLDDLRARIGILGHQASPLPATAPQTEGLDPVPQAEGIVPTADLADRWITLNVASADAAKGADAPTAKAGGAAAPPAAPPDGGNTVPASPAAPPPASSRPNHFRVTAGKQPGKPLYAGVEYTRDVSAAGDGIALAASVRGRPSIQGSYSRDFVAFDALGGRRLTLTVSGESSYLPDHVVDAATVDERRSGGSVAAGLELFRDRDGHWLSLDASLGYDDLDQRDRATSAVRRGWLGKARIGLNYRWLDDRNPDLPRLEIDPTIDLGRSNGRGTYVKPAADARFHSYLPGFFEFDAHGAAAWASAATPGTELPRFGGSGSVRGFKEEVAAARAAWAVQNEIYVPIRFLASIAPGVDVFVRRRLKLAGFVDLGGAGRNDQGISGFEAGAGVGLRLILTDQAAVRLDWAHPLTRYRPQQGGSGVYFSIAVFPQRF